MSSFGDNTDRVKVFLVIVTIILIILVAGPLLWRLFWGLIKAFLGR